MYKYFGVGPQLFEDVANEFPRFLYWIPMNRLSTLLKFTLKAWQMVIDGIDAKDVSFIFSFHLWKFDFILLHVGLSFFILDAL